MDKESAEKMKESLMTSAESTNQPQQTGQQAIVLSKAEDIETTSKSY